MKFKKLDKETLSSVGHTRAMALLRVGTCEHLQELREGRLRFCPPSYYSKTELFKLHYHDPNEGLKTILQSDETDIILTIGKKQVKISKENGLTGQVLIREPGDYSILCFHAIYADEKFHEFEESQISDFLDSLQVPARMNLFGDHVWVILQPDILFSRIVKKIRREKMGLQGKLVKYIDFADYHGDLPEEFRHFVKNKVYKDEREFRLRLDSFYTLPDPFYLDVGDLSDISQLLPLEGFRNIFEVKYEGKILKKPAAETVE